MKVRMTVETVIDVGDFEGYEDYRDAAWEIFCTNLEKYYVSKDVSYDVVPEEK